MNKAANEFVVILSTMLGLSIFIFVRFGDSNKYLFYFAGTLLTVTLVLGTWFRYFRAVKPLGLSIILTLIASAFAILGMYINKALKLTEVHGLVGIIAMALVSNILVKNLSHIEKIYDKLVKSKK